MENFLKRLANTLTISSELVHIFCCGIPIAVAIISLGASFAGVTVISAFHEFMHGYEVVVILVSAILLNISAIIQYISWQLNCKKTACSRSHADCTPKKFQANRIFWISCGLFVVNLLVFFWHRL